MATDIKLPELGEGVTEGELVKWLVKIGDSVKPDQTVAEIMTDKATVEVPSPVAGVVKELKFKPGQVIKVENVILTLDGAAAQSSQSAIAKPAAAPAAMSTAPASPSSASGKSMDVKLPELGEGVTEGELVKWLVKVGDTVKPDQTVAEIMTDKATVEVPSPFSGVVKELKFKTGEVIKVENVLLTLSGASGSMTSTAPTNGTANGQTKPAAQVTTMPAAAMMTSTTTRMSRR